MLQKLRGVEVIKNLHQSLPETPGIYRMYSQDDQILYVGKAKNIKKRVVSYSQLKNLPNRLQRMVNEISRIEIVTTASEVEALLLESNLIKKYKPPYNILLKDDKSFPYIVLVKHDFPRAIKYRGSKKIKGQYFGPFASVAAVDEAIITLQKLFQLRNCTDNFFSTRKRPCLQYYIKRCSAPCVDYISATEYKESVNEAKAFLEGKSNQVQQQLAQKMQIASNDLEFEKAAYIRDKIRMLTNLQARQRINVKGIENADVLALAQLDKAVCVQGFFFRNGRNYGTEVFTLQHTEDASCETLMANFLQQFYFNNQPPSLILLNYCPPDIELLTKTFELQFNQKVTLEIPHQGMKADLVKHALSNAQQHLRRCMGEKLSYKQKFLLLGELFNIPSIDTIEVYDNSHLQGYNAYGVCINVKANGFDTSFYRKFKIQDAILKYGGDDLRMMREVISRRLKYKDEWPLPSLFLIDGGQTQINTVYKVLLEHQLDIPVIGIAKGPKRNAGEETFYRIAQPPLKLTAGSPLLYFLQQIRDEAHRFAIGTHRAGRKKQLVGSVLDAIPGIGTKRKKALLQHFGSARAIQQASIEDLMMAKGISKPTAERIQHYFSTL